jgi:capsular polysaccharide transport system permease protein
VSTAPSVVPIKPVGAPTPVKAPLPAAGKLTTAPAAAAPVKPVASAPANVSAAKPAPVAAPAPTAKPDAEPASRIWTPAIPSRMRKRHVALLSSFLALVILPGLIATWYLYARAEDQYSSTLGFSVQRESLDSAFSLVSGLASISGSSSPDTDIIYRYIYSQSLVAEVDQEIDLRHIWSKAEGDFIFAYNKGGSIEDLVDYWGSMVKVHYDNATRLIEVRVLAFTPEDAQQIATLIFQKSTAMINRLNDEALADAVNFTASELDKARIGLIAARQAMTTFRNVNQLVDPAADAAAQMALVGSLEQSVAETRIELDLLLETTNANDPRIPPLRRRIEVIQAQIQTERAKLGVGTAGGEGSVMADVVADYERLKVDQEFAEAAYQAARASHESALSEAQRQSRFLAAHILPTKAETARDPKRFLMLSVLVSFLFLFWATGALIYYSLRDRR